MIDPTLYLTKVAWETLAKNIVMLSPWTYRVTVKYENVGNVGRGQQEVGFYFKDFLGETYLITAINVGGIAGDIEITDSFKCGHGPVSDRTAIVYKSVGDGESPFLAPVMYQRLDKSALDRSRAIELDIIWKNSQHTLKIDFEDTNMPAIEEYARDYAGIFGQYPRLTLVTVDENNNRWYRQETPLIYLGEDGKISRIAWDDTNSLSDNYTGFILISK